MNWFYQFFCWAGGGNIAVLKEMSTEQNRFFGYGTVICMTALFATLSAAYAFSLLLKEEIGVFYIIPALVWGFFIFTIDRFFIVTISSQGSFEKKLLMAIPRLILAVFIGIIISKPLEFRIFQREINDQLVEIKEKEKNDIDTLYTRRIKNERDQERKEIVTFLDKNQEYKHQSSRIVELKTKLTDKEKDISDKDHDIKVEIDGTGGSGDKGCGPICEGLRARKRELENEKQQLVTQLDKATGIIKTITDDFQQEIDSVISPKYQKIIKGLENELVDQKKELQNNYKPSILNQQIALAKIQNDKDKPTAFYTVWFVTILFIFIEMAPMLLKLMTKAGPYENRIAKLEAAYSTDDRLNRALDLEEYKSNRSLVRQLARSQRTIISKAMDQWHNDQMERLQNDPEYYTDIFNEKKDTDHIN